MQRNPPQFLRLGSVAMVNLFGLLLGLPVLFAVAWVSFRPLSPVTFILPVAALTLAAVYLPVGLGNPWIRRVCRRLKLPFDPTTAHVVQLTARPRLQSGMRGLLEDADDVGYLRVYPEGIEFFGDCSWIRIPRGSIRSVRLQNIGFRGLFVYGSRIVVQVEGLSPDTLEFAERSTDTLFASRKKTQEIFASAKG